MATLKIKAPDGKTLKITIPDTTPEDQYDSMVDEVLADYALVSKPRSLSERVVNVGSALAGADIPDKDKVMGDVLDLSAVPARGLRALGTTAIGMNRDLMEAGKDLLTGQDTSLRSDLASTILEAGGVAEGEEAKTIAGKIGAFIGDFFDPRWLAIGGIVGEVLGRVLPVIAKYGIAGVGRLTSILSPGQSTKLLDFLRANPEFIKFVQKMVGNTQARLTRVAPAAEEALQMGKKFGREKIMEETVQMAKAARGEIQKDVFGTTARSAEREARRAFELNPEQFIDDLKAVVQRVKDSKITDIAKVDPNDRAILMTATDILSKGMGGTGTMANMLSALKSLGIGSGVAAFINPALGALAAAVEYALSRPGIAMGAQRFFGAALEQAPKLSKIATKEAAPIVGKAVKTGLEALKD